MNKSDKYEIFGTIMLLIFIFIIGISFVWTIIEKRCDYIDENGENNIRYVNFMSDNGYCIIVDDETHIAYIQGYNNSNSKNLLPYYSENGKLQKYDDGKFIEVGD
jgi:hypothetical protein